MRNAIRVGLALASYALSIGNLSVNRIIPRVSRVSMLAAVLIAFLIRGGRAAEIDTGTGSFQFAGEGNANKPITVWYHAPAKLRANAPIVFVMHGVRRNGAQYRDQWVEHSEKRSFLLIVPEFSAASYPGEAYSQGNMFDEQGRPTQPSEWTFNTIERLFDHVKTMSGNTSTRYFLYGHSAGGQFVHRLALFLPEARYQRAIAANPGWYTMPDTAIPFPYGLAHTTATEQTLAKSFANPLVLLLGDEDVKRDDPNLRKTPEADAQGQNRFARGKQFSQVARQKADELNAPLKWRQQTVRGAGHSDKQMSKAAVAVLFGR